MRKSIVTHPDNLEYVREIFKDEYKKEKESCQGFIHFIDPFSSAIEIKTDIYMEKERWTGRYKIKQNKFYTYWDGNGEPPSWCLYFGFVEKEMEPNYVEIKFPRMTFYDPAWDMGMKIKDNRNIIMNAS